MCHVVDGEREVVGNRADSCPVCSCWVVCSSIREARKPHSAATFCVWPGTCRQWCRHIYASTNVLRGKSKIPTERIARRGCRGDVAAGRSCGATRTRTLVHRHVRHQDGKTVPLQTLQSCLHQCTRCPPSNPATGNISATSFGIVR